jgi:hypothetical protein
MRGPIAPAAVHEIPASPGTRLILQNDSTAAVTVDLVRVWRSGVEFTVTLVLANAYGGGGFDDELSMAFPRFMATADPDAAGYFVHVAVESHDGVRSNLDAGGLECLGSTGRDHVWEARFWLPASGELNRGSLSVTWAEADVFGHGDLPDLTHHLADVVSTRTTRPGS